jgi:hypothetical protein
MERIPNTAEHKIETIAIKFNNDGFFLYPIGEVPEVLNNRSFFVGLRALFFIS